MDGVRRLFAGAATRPTGTTTTTAVEQPYPTFEDAAKSSWNPQLPPGAMAGSSSSAARLTRSPSPPPNSKYSLNQQAPTLISLPSRQNSAPLSPDDTRTPSRRGTSNSLRSQSPHYSKRPLPGHSKAVSSLSRSRSELSGTPPLPPPVLNSKDELIIEVLASEAVVDSQEYEMLGAEEVEELKRELKNLSSRVAAANKKVKLETKLRDAALSLDKIQSAHKRSQSKAANGNSSDALEAANQKVQNAQTELSKLSDRHSDVQRRLLEHRSAVLSYSLNRMEAMLKPKAAETSGRTTPANLNSNANIYGGELSPTSAVTSMSLNSRAKFEGPHFFAGHADAAVPRGSSSRAQLSALEEQLAATRAEEEELKQEVARLLAAQNEAESNWSLKLSEAEDSIGELRSQLSDADASGRRVKELEYEKEEWQSQRTKFERQLAERERSNTLQSDLVKKDEEIEELRVMLEQERQEREDERHAWEDEKMEDLARLQQEMDDLRAKDAEAARSADVELDMVSERLQAVIRTHSIQLSASQRRDMSTMALVNALGSHLDSQKEHNRTQSRDKEEWESTKRRLEADLATSLERRDKLLQEVEQAREERETARKEIRILEDRLRDQPERLERAIPSKSNSLGSDPGSSNGSRSSEDMDRILSTLRSLWVLLPSREARAAKSNGRSGSPTSPMRPVGRLGEPPSPSLSDLDVRALKALYDPRNNTNSPLFNNFSNPADFNIEAFAQRVQALVADDRAIIERLLRFAQAHDLLKNNAERAQKLAQESSMGLETYHKQVKALEERNATLVTKQTDLLDEINNLQRSIERVQKDKRELEMKYTDQSESLQNLSDANSTLSARAMALAEEVATAPEQMRIKMEAQLAEVRRQLKESMDEIEGMRMSEQTQKAALLEELNVVQGENIKLRDQLRAEQRKNGSK